MDGRVLRCTRATAHTVVPADPLRFAESDGTANWPKVGVWPAACGAARCKFSQRGFSFTRFVVRKESKFMMHGRCRHKRRPDGMCVRAFVC